MTTLRILFVDDEQRILDGLRRMLRPFRNEWDMSFVTSGPEALAALDDDKYDVIVSDVRMPGMDGIDLLEKVRESHRDLIRIVLSGHSEEVDTLRSTTVAHQYLAKPCEADLIRSTVSRSTALRQDLANPQLLAAIASTRNLPAAPSLYQQLTQELTSDDASISRVASIVAQDPGLTAKILQMVNSAFFALRRTVTNIDEAVTMLGIDTIMALALTTHLFKQGTVTPSQQSIVEAVWTRSLAVATLAKAVCHAEGGSRALAQEAFLAGMLHHAGQVVFAMNWPDRVAAGTPDLEQERTEFGADHGVVGAYLLAIWGLPDVIVEAVAYHHRPSQAPSDASPVLTAVHAAHSLENRVNGSPPTFDDEYLKEAGLQDRVDAWLEIAGEIAYQRENP